MGGGPEAPALVGQGQQLTGLIPQAQLVSNAHRKFLPPCRTRQKSRGETSPDSFPLGRQPWGTLRGGARLRRSTYVPQLVQDFLLKPLSAAHCPVSYTHLTLPTIY